MSARYDVEESSSWCAPASWTAEFTVRDQEILDAMEPELRAVVERYVHAERVNLFDVGYENGWNDAREGLRT